MNGRKRVIIEKVFPEIDGGKYPVKRVLGAKVAVKAYIISDGHDEKTCFLYYKHASEKLWKTKELKLLYNDEWIGEFTVEKEGLYFYTIKAWIDHFKTWQHDLKKRIEAGQDIEVDMQIGRKFVEEAAGRAPAAGKKKLRDYAEKMAGSGKSAVNTALNETLLEIMIKYPDKETVSEYERELKVYVEREKAGFSAWYEMFPRSASDNPEKHGTFKDVVTKLPEIAEMGFDVLYFPPIHPIGITKRKGKNNSLEAGPDDPGSPWAVGAKEGGHKSIHPQLGTMKDFKKLLEEAKKYNIETALDIAFQCSNDHPYIKEHPEWFLWRPDGTIQSAENPPKKYEDIVPFNFETDKWKELRDELVSIFKFWAEKGVRIFRVDNPHTKPFDFWEYAIAEVKKDYTDVIFLAEAFTRPKIMYRLAKAGFTQSYTYFTWRNTKAELSEYISELTQGEPAEIFRPNFWPNTPDILHEYLQKGGRPAFVTRLILAAVISPNYGIYGGAYLLCENEPYPGKEEYINNEKYEIKSRDISAEGSLKPEAALINRIRRENPALKTAVNTAVCAADNDNIFAWARYTDDGSNVIIAVVNLDPFNTQEGQVELPAAVPGLDGGGVFSAEDLFGGGSYKWNAGWNYVKLDPLGTNAHILRVKKTGVVRH